MILKLKDELIRADKCIGPMPNFCETFEKFFIEKSAALIYGTLQKGGLNRDKNDPNCQYISIEDTASLSWMHSINLANNRSEQNLEIIYNEKSVYFKTLRTIYKNDQLLAFPSKDLEISLGLQFVPINTDNHYVCRKCKNTFNYQYHIMLHNRYFCSLLVNNFFLRSVVDSTIMNQCTAKKEKRKLCDQFDLNGKKTKLTNSIPNINGHSHEANMSQHSVQANKIDQLNENYFESLLANFISSESVSLNTNRSIAECGLTNNNNGTDLIRSVLYMYAQQQMSSQFYNKNFLNANLLVNNINQAVFLSQSNHINVTSNNNNNINNNNSVVNVPRSNSDFNKISKKQHTNPSSTSNTRLTTKPASYCTTNELNQMINTQTLQNWCAKCNTHFRLTTDLVFHMRTYHRNSKKDDDLQTTAPVVAEGNEHKTYLNNLSNSDNCHLNERTQANGITPTSRNSDLKPDKSEHYQNLVKHKYLKCEICHEVFKEKHHLSRHMTSHR